MAFKSPGIYFTEIDNTEYTNPAAEINTTVAIIGFAKKGPIGEPTEINSYSDFKSIFGAPITGTYAGLAVRSILSAGGTVLFVRIADESLASKSNVILKNSSESTKGALIVNNKNAITVGQVINGKTFKNGELYCSYVKDSSNDKKKTVMLRTPSSGRFTLSDLVEQFNKGLKNQFGFTEYTFNSPTESSYRVFGIKSGDGNVVGPYFVGLTASESGDLVASEINNVIAKGTNPYQILKPCSYYYISDGSLDLVENSTNVKENIIVPDGDISNAYLKGGVANGTYRFYIKKENQDDKTVVKVEIPTVENITFKEIAKLIDDVLVSKNIGIRCKLIYDKGYKDDQTALQHTDDSDIDSLSFLFFSTDYVNFEILPFIETNGNELSYKKSLFMPVFMQGDKVIGEATPSYISNKLPYVTLTDNGGGTVSHNWTTNNSGIEGAPEQPGSLALYVLPPISSSSENNTASAMVSFDKGYTENLIFTVANKKEEEVEETEIAISDYTFNVEINDDETVANDNYLFQRNLESITQTTDETTSLYLSIASENKKAIGKYVRSYTGEKGLDNVTITRESDQRIYINQTDGLDAPEIKHDSELDKITTYSLNDLFGPLTTEADFEQYNYIAGKDSVLIKREGSQGVSAENNDMIIFTAKEYGSGTTNVAVEIYTSVSPLDESEKVHYIDLYVDGIKKESWEDVSYNPEDDNYFEKLINEDPENGGSAYVNVTVKRGNKLSGEVEVPETASLTSSGLVYLGSSINNNSISYDDSTAEKETEYQYYDYKLGNDGVPNGDVDDLFMSAMDTETSGLSNKDLYSWHILITPDDGQNEDIQNAAIELCEYMEDAIYIADPPQGLSRDGVINWHNGASQQRTTALQSNYCCTYWPWVKVYNAIESKYQYVMPSIVMAAQFCKVDNNYGPWYAPAGATNGYCSTVLDLEVNSKDKRYPNKIDRDNLYLDQNRINPFLKLRNGNILAYGEKTCQRKNSTLTKIHTRRMLIALKKELNSAIKGYIFQPTVAENINKIRNSVTTIMETYKNGGAVDSYNIDTSMNTTETLQQDILYIAISCVPVGCIEQVEITFTLNKSAD